MAYGMHRKTGSKGGRIGQHGDGCMCKCKRANKARARRLAKDALRKYL